MSARELVPPFCPWARLGSVEDLVARFNVPYPRACAPAPDPGLWLYVEHVVALPAPRGDWHFMIPHIIYSHAGPAGIFHGAVALGEEEEP